MALIEETKPGRGDGGYARLFEDSELGALLSRVHATVIRAGNELEAIIEKHARCVTEAEAKEFVKGSLLPGTYLIPKKTLKKVILPLLPKVGEPDFVVVIVVDKQCKVIELKDGDTFDTKKADGEIAKLEKFSAALQELKPDYVVTWHACFFYVENRAQIVQGLKGRIQEKNGLTGRELCELLRISYSTIVEQRKQYGPANIDFFVRSLLAVQSIKDRL